MEVNAVTLAFNTLQQLPILPKGRAKPQHDVQGSVQCAFPSHSATLSGLLSSSTRASLGFPEPVKHALLPHHGTCSLRLESSSLG